MINKDFEIAKVFLPGIVKQDFTATYSCIATTFSCILTTPGCFLNIIINKCFRV